MNLPHFIRKFLVQEPTEHDRQTNVPDHLFVACTKCKTTLYQRKLASCWFVCPACGHHLVMPTTRWVEMLADPHSFSVLFNDLKSNDPLTFPEYKHKLSKANKVDPSESVLTGSCTLQGRPVLLGIMNPLFFMGSLGVVAGERLARLFEKGVAERKPVILVVRSGGARMQEGVLSLMQMAKVSVAIKRFNDAGLLYISILTHPTTGGVSASFAMQGDITLAEPDAMIGFAGPRVIEQTIKQKLPDDFQKSEFVLKHGHIDSIIPRTELKERLDFLLNIHLPGHSISPELAPRKTWTKRFLQWIKIV